MRTGEKTTYGLKMPLGLGVEEGFDLLCCRGEWAEDVSSTLGFTCYKNRFMVSFLPLLGSVIY